MTPTQSPTLASQATAELPKLPPPLIRREDFPAFQAKIAMNCYSAVQMDHRWREGYEAGRESRAQSEPELLESANALLFVVKALASELGIDPETTEFRFTAAGKPIAEFSLAKVYVKADTAIAKATPPATLGETK